MRLISSLVLLNIALIGLGQEAKTASHWSVASGFLQLKELNLESVIHSGPGLELVYRCSIAQRGQLKVSFSYASLSSRFETFGSSHLAQLQAAYGLPVWQKSLGQWQFELQPFTAMNYRLAFMPNWDESHLYWANTLSLELAVKASRPLKQNAHLETEVSLPFLAAVSRPNTYRNYKIDDLSMSGMLNNFHSNISVGSWDRYFSFNWKFGYRLPKIGYFYAFNYAHVQSEPSESQLILFHQIGLQWQF